MDLESMLADIPKAKERHLASLNLPQIQCELPDKMGMIYGHEFGRKQAIAAKSKGRGLFMSYTGFTKAFSQTSLKALTPILMKNLMLNKVHKGRYLLARIITKPNRTLCTSFIIEDITGAALSYSIYNDVRVGELRSGDAQLDALFPLYSIVCIREPFLKTVSTSGVGLQPNTGFVRSDSPSDLVFLSPTSPLLDNIKWSTPAPIVYSPATYRALGDEFYKKKDYIVAQFLFTQAIEATPVDSSTKLLPLYRNRSMAAFSVGNFATSARDCKKILGMLQLGTPVPKNDPELRENTIKRLANAQYGQRKFSAALTTFIKLVVEFPSNGAGRIGIDRCEKRLVESKSGEYDWESIAQLSNSRVKQEIRFNLDVGDYYNPGIEIQKAEGRGGGRGVFATRDIALGELLIVEKAFSTGYESTVEGIKGMTIVAINFMTGSSHHGSHLNTIVNMIGKAIENPTQLKNLINSSFSGDGSFPSTARFPQTGDEEEELELLADGSMKPADIDIARYEAIGEYNFFAIGDGSTGSKAVGYFPRSSLFNHTCISSASWKTVGDLMVIRASQDIESGSEIFISYISALVVDREESLRKHFTNGCGCSLCLEEGALSPITKKKRKLAIEKLEELRTKSETATSIGLVKKNILLLKPLITSLASTYSPTARKIHLFRYYHLLATFYYVLGQQDKSSHLLEAIQADFKALDSLGLVVSKINLPMMISGDSWLLLDELDQITTIISDSYSRLGNEMANEAWTKTNLELRILRSG